MEIKLKDVNKYVAAIEKLSAEKMPLKTAFKLAKLKKEVSAQSEFYDDNYRKIILDCAQLDKDGIPISYDGGKTIQLKHDKIEETNQRMNELNELTQEIGDYKFKIEEFGDIEIDADTLGALMDFMEE